MTTIRCDAFMTTCHFFNLTVSHIQSQSIQAWATSAHNRPILLKEAARLLKLNSKADPLRFATTLTLLATGAV